MRSLGVSLVILGAICWGVSGGIADSLMAKGWDPIVIALYRGAVGFVCFLAWFLFRFKQNRISWNLCIWSLLAGVGVAGNFAFYFLAIKASGVAVAATLMYTAPVFVLIIAFLLRMERSTWFKWGCILFVLLGILMLTGAYNTGAVSVGLTGVGLGLAAGLSYALFIFGFKNASSIGKPQTTLTIAFFVFCLLLSLLADFGEVGRVMKSGDLWLFMLLGVLGAGISFIVYVIGIQWTAPTTASMVAMVEPVTASLFGFLVFRDQLTLIQLLGMALILVTVIFLSVKKPVPQPIHTHQPS
ncbi:DMT family transporter [Halobacillus salinus]|uniref:DMT family transporter n=1 Tax=Halobacillus salinus TaxID=192814 RepID=UPI0009A6995E|nr:DMT family transporter [Halobacillus salinus]